MDGRYIAQRLTAAAQNYGDVLKQPAHPHFARQATAGMETLRVLANTAQDATAYMTSQPSMRGPARAALYPIYDKAADNLLLHSATLAAANTEAMAGLYDSAVGVASDLYGGAKTVVTDLYGFFKGVAGGAETVVTDAYAGTKAAAQLPYDAAQAALKAAEATAQTIKTVAIVGALGIVGYALIRANKSKK